MVERENTINRVLMDVEKLEEQLTALETLFVDRETLQSDREKTAALFMTNLSVVNDIKKRLIPLSGKGGN